MPRKTLRKLERIFRNLGSDKLDIGQTQAIKPGSITEAYQSSAVDNESNYVKWLEQLLYHQPLNALAIEDLDMQGNIGDKAVCALAAGLESNKTLKLLLLYGNRITDKGANALANVLKKHPSLTLRK